jgi:hypothetical protein
MQAFLRAYREALVARYDWAKDPMKLGIYMISVQRTLEGENTWNHAGEAVTEAWRAIGGTGKPTRKALRAMPRMEN